MEVCVNAPQDKPPLAAGTRMTRDCVARPVPHEAEQVLGVDQALITQSTGHARELHEAACVSRGHVAPPKAEGVVMLRDRVLDPPPQLTEHTP